jgi:predicted amidohydrolase
MCRPLPLALVQAPPLEDPTAPDALDRYEADVASVLRRFPATRLVVHPELHLTWVPGDLEASVAEPLDGPRVTRLREIAARHGVWLVPGSVLETGDDGAVHNTALLLSPTGELTASYRKIFPWRPYEPTTPGEKFVVADLDGIGRIGLSICYDTWFPEHARQLAWLGAEVIVTVVMTTSSDRPQELVLTRANAIANQVHVVAVNTAGPVGTGRSLVVDPEGRVRVESPDATPSVIVDVVDLDDVTRVRQYGTAGLNRLWDQFGPDDAPLELPAYGGRIDPLTWRPRAR